MTHTCSLHEALEIFEENLADVRVALIENAGCIIEEYKPYAQLNIESPFTKDSIHLHVNYLGLQSKLTPILSSVKRIDSYRYYSDPKNKSNAFVTDMDIQRAREADADWFISEAQLSTRKPHQGICPFHPDTNASLMLMQSKAKGTLYLKCFPCSASWDSIAFIMKRDGVGFIDAVKRII